MIINYFLNAFIMRNGSVLHVLLLIFYDARDENDVYCFSCFWYNLALLEVAIGTMYHSQLPSKHMPEMHFVCSSSCIRYTWLCWSSCTSSNFNLSGWIYINFCGNYCLWVSFNFCAVRGSWTASNFLHVNTAVVVEEHTFSLQSTSSLSLGAYGHCMVSILQAYHALIHQPSLP